MSKKKPEFKFNVSSRQRLYDTFLELYPDLAKYVWGFDPFNWDNNCRSILIRMSEDPLEPGTRILFEIRKDQKGKWGQMRTLMIPFLLADSEGRLCVG